MCSPSASLLMCDPPYVICSMFLCSLTASRLATVVTLDFFCLKTENLAKMTLIMKNNMIMCVKIGSMSCGHDIFS